MRQTTICLLVTDNKILLAMKKRGHGVGKWNGAGGKAVEGETIEQTAIRETQEEIGVTPLHLEKVGAIAFYFSPELKFDHTTTIFLCDKWAGELKESEEMRPQWFAKENIPYDEMWESDRKWLPKIMSGKKITATARYDAVNSMIEYSEKEVSVL
ncbi:MAG TPA: 8-oxo-dGTP diphosphatase [Candidatus Saccharimonadales bacterium]|nr:8-oxo-dGTP diphosphatase [Candidatus Saccharimonadales bacterium]